MGSRNQVKVGSVFLELPAADLEPLAGALDCQLSRQASQVTLSRAGSGSLVFDLEGERAALVHLTTSQLGFLRHVVGPLFHAYDGDLDAQLVRSPPAAPVALRIRGGESAHPLLDPGVELLAGWPPSVDEALAEARAAWDEYRALCTAAELKRP